MTAPPTHLRALREGATNRRLELARMLREDPTATNLELAKALNVSRNTITSDRVALMGLANQEAKTEMQLYRDDQLTRVQEKWDEIEADFSMTGAEKHLAWSRWMKLEMDLRGTAAPSKSISAHVTANPEHSKEYLLFREAVAGLVDDQLHEVYDFAKRLQRVPVVNAKDASWFPAPMKPQLEAGSDE